MADGSDLARFGVNVDDLFDDDGQVDPDRVTAAVNALLAQRPHLQARRSPRPDRSQGSRGGASGNGPTFADVLRGGVVRQSMTGAGPVRCGVRPLPLERWLVRDERRFIPSCGHLDVVH